MLDTYSHRFLKVLEFEVAFNKAKYSTSFKYKFRPTAARYQAFSGSYSRKPRVLPRKGRCKPTPTQTIDRCTESTILACGHSYKHLCPPEKHVLYRLQTNFYEESLPSFFLVPSNSKMQPTGTIVFHNNSFWEFIALAVRGAGRKHGLMKRERERD
jgi:hypothetical protein